MIVQVGQKAPGFAMQGIVKGEIHDTHLDGRSVDEILRILKALQTG
jgi:alkyl hydroperoxide reductase subunit AhpC